MDKYIESPAAKFSKRTSWGIMPDFDPRRNKLSLADFIYINLLR